MANAKDALRKLQSGQTLTNADRQVLGMSPAPAAPVGTPFGQAGSAPTYNQRVVEAIRTANQANVDVNANPVVTPEPDLEEPIEGDGKILGTEDAEIGQGEDPNLVPDDGEKPKTFTWTDPDTGQMRAFNSPEELTAFVQSWSTNKTITANQSAKAEEEKLKKERENAAKKTAQQEFRAALTELGLGDLADTVDEMIRQDFTAAQIKLDLPKQPA